MTLNLMEGKNKDKIGKKPKDMTIQELNDEIAKLQKEGIDPVPLINRNS